MRTLVLIISAVLFCSSFSVLRKAPAGTHSISGLTNTFMDKTEVTNAAWREYLAEISTTGDSAHYLKALPDLAVWEMAYGENFLKTDGYDNYPVVGISYRQAVDYCEWRSEWISLKEGRNISFSLPEMKHYKLCLHAHDGNKIAEGLYSTGLGFRSFLGLCDNAAEMTAEEGKAVQGSDREDCMETYEYYSPSPKLGFRCTAKLY